MRFASRILARLRPGPEPPAFRHRRFLSGRAGEGSRFLAAARDYVANKPEGEVAWLYCKPYDRSPGNPEFFSEIYQVVNLLQAMSIRPFGRVLEVGSGPGWVTEILMLLGSRVDAVEPTGDMIAIAERRIALARELYRLEDPPEVRFHETTLEDCELPDETFDAILFHEALHHVIDEEKGLAQSFRLLRPGGVLGVSEWAWIPGEWTPGKRPWMDRAVISTRAPPSGMKRMPLAISGQPEVKCRARSGQVGWNCRKRLPWKELGESAEVCCRLRRRKTSGGGAPWRTPQRPYRLGV